MTDTSRYLVGMQASQIVRETADLLASLAPDAVVTISVAISYASEDQTAQGGYHVDTVAGSLTNATNEERLLTSLAGVMTGVHHILDNQLEELGIDRASFARALERRVREDTETGIVIQLS
jgi:hypothetical protein